MSDDQHSRARGPGGQAARDAAENAIAAAVPLAASVMLEALEAYAAGRKAPRGAATAWAMARYVLDSARGIQSPASGSESTESTTVDELAKRREALIAASRKARGL